MPDQERTSKCICCERASEDERFTGEFIYSPLRALSKKAGSDIPAGLCDACTIGMGLFCLSILIREDTTSDRDIGNTIRDCALKILSDQKLEDSKKSMNGGDAL